MAHVIEVGLDTTKIFILFTLLSGCWGQLGGAQGPQYYHANAVSFRYEGTSSPDIKMSNGTKIDPCRSQWKYPCFNYDSQAKIVDLLSDQCENLMQFKIFGTPVEQLVNASKEQICCGYSLASNPNKNVSCPDTMNDTRFYFDDHDCFSIQLSYILAITFSHIGYNGINLFLIFVIIYLCYKNKFPTKERDAIVVQECGTYQQLRRRTCCTALADLISEICFCTTPSQPWKCQCEKCLLPKPVLFNYDGKSYVVFVIENEAERSKCIDPHLEKYQQYFNVANVFVVVMDDVDAATSAEYLPVWYKESHQWNHSLLKDKVFLSTPVSQSSPSRNSPSRFMGIGGEIQKLTKIPEVQNKVLTDAPVQMNLVVPQSQENKEKGSPVTGINHRRTRSSAPTSVHRVVAGGIAMETGLEQKVRSASFNALSTLSPDLRDEHEEPKFIPNSASN